MNGFDFSEISGISTSTGAALLEGNKIHDVVFDGCEARNFKGKDGSEKHVITVKFKNDEGIFTHTIWEPSVAAGDFVDKTDPYPSPSVIKHIMVFVKHLTEAVNPKAVGDLGKKTPSWDAFRHLVVDITTPGIGVATKIKLLTDKSGNAIFPRYFLGYTKENELFMRTKFIGNNLKFTDKEMTTIKAAATATPSASPDDFSTDMGMDNAFDSLNFDLNS